MNRNRVRLMVACLALSWPSAYLNARAKPVPTALQFVHSTPTPIPVPSPIPPSDDVGTLITEEHSKSVEWDDADGDLPPLTMVGDPSGFLVYASANERGRDPMLCSGIAFDELFDPSQPELMTGKIILNTAKPRIKEALIENCLIRPGDPVMAIGPGWQEPVAAARFVVRPEKFRCSNDPLYSLWVEFDGALPSDPIFFTTDLGIPHGSNWYQPMSELGQESVPAPLRSQVAELIPFLEEYELRIFKIGALNCDRLIHIRKKTVSLNDADLPHEAVLTEKGGQVEILLSEKVNPRRGTGRINVAGILNFNQDHHIDVVLEGDHENCPFRAVFQGIETGFEQLELPLRACACL